MNTLANFSNTSYKPNKHMKAAKSAVNAGIGWGGTGALGSLLARPDAARWQRKVAGGAALLGAANSLRKSYFPRKQMSNRIKKKRII